MEITGKDRKSSEKFKQLPAPRRNPHDRIQSSSYRIHSYRISTARSDGNPKKILSDFIAFCRILVRMRQNPTTGLIDLNTQEIQSDQWIRSFPASDPMGSVAFRSVLLNSDDFLTNGFRSGFHRKISGTFRKIPIRNSSEIGGIDGN